MKRTIVTGISVLVLTFIINGCTTLRMTITSDPPGADVYSGAYNNQLTPVNQKTPFTTTHTDIGAFFKPWYFQVKKAGYYDSEIIFRDKETADRVINFSLKEKNGLSETKTTNSPELPVKSEKDSSATDVKNTSPDAGSNSSSGSSSESKYGSPSSNPLPDLDYSKPVDVKGYYRKDGTYVRPHTRSYRKK